MTYEPEPPSREQTMKKALDQLPEWLRSTATWATTESGTLAESEDGHVARIETDPEHALLIGSKVKDPWGHERYRLVLDLDRHNVALLPSSTPGHHHLVIDTRLGQFDHNRVLEALAAAGVIEWGFAESGQRSPLGATMRPPWVRKGEDKTLAQQHGWLTPAEQVIYDELAELNVDHETCLAVARRAVDDIKQVMA